MLRLAQHARERMRRRGITESEVEEALANITAQWPSDEYPDERTVICGTTRNGRRLKVVLPTADTGYVITVMDRDDER